MKRRMGVLGAVTLCALSVTVDWLACGDKFLVTGRGTRYQRPKNARAASVLIYADASAGLTPAIRSGRLESALKHEGHRSTFVGTFDQLAAILAGGRFDVILATSTVAGGVEKLLQGAPDAAVVVALDAQPKGRSLLEAIDKAVEQRDKNLRKAATRS